jgi:outer membrane lipoprotein SlyB
VAPPPAVAPAPAVSPPPPAVCYDCGTVTSVRTVRKQGEATIVGPLAGGAIGGLVGNQIGSGSGRTAATIVGAAGGAVVGTEVERRSKTTTQYVVGVRMEDGTMRRFTYRSAPGMREGDRVRVLDGKLVRDS